LSCVGLPEMFGREKLTSGAESAGSICGFWHE
jgi:hypothetical protein